MACGKRRSRVSTKKNNQGKRRAPKLEIRRRNIVFVVQGKVGKISGVGTPTRPRKGVFAPRKEGGGSGRGLLLGRK